jgi:hypothetical protein
MRKGGRVDPAWDAVRPFVGRLVGLDIERRAADHLERHQMHVHRMSVPVTFAYTQSSTVPTFGVSVVGPSPKCTALRSRNHSTSSGSISLSVMDRQWAQSTLSRRQLFAVLPRVPH